MAEGSADDVKYVCALLDDLATVTDVDTKRVFATGISNGGIDALSTGCGNVGSNRRNCSGGRDYRHRREQTEAARAGDALSYGKADNMVPFGGPDKGTPKFLTFKSVEESVAIWRKINECPDEPTITEFPDKEDDGTKVTKKTYGPGKNGAEVVLIEIEGGGHNWPGRNADQPDRQVNARTFQPTT